MKPSGTIVSFSPTIDQVVKTVEVLREHNFACIETFECIMRGMQIERGKTRPQTLMTGHTGYITHARRVIKVPTIEQQVPESQSALEPPTETEGIGSEHVAESTETETGVVEAIE